MYYILIAIVSYLTGSISTGLLVAKTDKEVNLHEMGSKSTGASNVLRVMGAKAGVLTFLGDALKAILSCLVGNWLGGHFGTMLAGLFCIIGHNWPVFFGFKGGKGVACSVAVILMTYAWPAGIIAIAICLLVIALTRFISAGSMSMMVVFAILVFIQTSFAPLESIWAFILAMLCIYRHRANIQRMINHTENRLGKKNN